MFDISGKSVLITGGTSGIGAAVANHFFDAGCKVIAAGLPDEKPSSDLKQRDYSGILNVSDPASVERLVAGYGPARCAGKRSRDYSAQRRIRSGAVRDRR